MFWLGIYTLIHILMGVLIWALIVLITLEFLILQQDN